MSSHNYDYVDPEFWHLLKYKRSTSTYEIRDVYDGLKYSVHCQPGQFLCQETNPANVSFILNKDGFAIFRSSSTDIWPVFIAVNELPSDVRQCLCLNRENYSCHILCFVDSLRSMSSNVDCGIAKINLLNEECILCVVKDSTSSCSSCNKNYITTTSLALMNFIMSYDRECDLIGFRLHEQEPAIQRIIVAVRAMRVYNQPHTVVNIWIQELL